MNGDNHELTGNERYGHLAGRAFQSASLSRRQRDRHLARLAETGRRRQEGRPRLRAHVAELGAIAAVLVVAVGLVAVWQGPGLPSNSDSASLPTATTEQSTPEPTTEPAAVLLTPTITSESGTGEAQSSPTVTNGTAVSSCPVTPYSNGQPSDGNQAAFTDTWFGEEGGLWAGLGPENGGVWSANNELRVLWWYGGFDSVTVTGERLDGEAPPLEIEQRRPFHLTTFPTPGCWKVTGQTDDLELSFVVNVVPREQDPQYQEMQEQKAEVEAERQSAIPGPVPTTCDAREWLGPERRFFGFSSNSESSSDWELTYSYWLDGEGISLKTDLGVFFEGENDVVWVWGTEELIPFPDEATITAERIDGQASPAEITFDDRRRVGVAEDEENVNLLGSTITFPEPGCWRIQVDTDQLSLGATVYAYPADSSGDDASATATPMSQSAEERVAQLERERQQLRSQPVPETCQVTGWTGPDFRVRRSDYYAYWLEGDDLALGERHGLLFEGDNDVGWLAGSGMSTEEAVGGQIEITGERLDGDTLQPVSLDVGTQISTNIITDESVERGWESTLTFPDPGCWNIQAQIGPNTLDETVYVFSVGESE